MAATHINQKQFQDLLQQGRPVLVDFWAPWCGYCRRIDTAYEKIAEQYGGELAVVKVNIDDAPQLAETEQIELIPTLVLYVGGKAAGSIVAPESKAMIDTFIRDTLAKCQS